MNQCIFCNIVEGKIPTDFIHKDEFVVVFKDVDPKAPVHLLAVPVRHISSLSETSESDEVLLGRILITIKQVAQKAGISESGYKIICNNGKASGQIVFHLHFHVLGGWKNQEYFDI